ASARPVSSAGCAPAIRGARLGSEPIWTACRFCPPEPLWRAFPFYACWLALPSGPPGAAPARLFPSYDCPSALSWTHGQVAWALARGAPPAALLIDQLRYLRQLGVPFSKSELGSGRGHRIRYGFDHLIELGVALFGLQRGLAPREVAGILVDHRAELRRCYRDIVAALPDAAFEAEWVKSRGAMVPLINEAFLRLHDRYAEQPGSYELVPGDPLALLQQFATATERYPGGETRTLVPLTR